MMLASPRGGRGARRSSRRTTIGVMLAFEEKYAKSPWRRALDSGQAGVMYIARVGRANRRGDAMSTGLNAWAGASRATGWVPLNWSARSNTRNVLP